MQSFRQSRRRSHRVDFAWPSRGMTLAGWPFSPRAERRMGEGQRPVEASNRWPASEAYRYSALGDGGDLGRRSSVYAAAVA